MTALLDDFESFKRRVGQLEALVNQSKGAYKETMARLKKEFGCATLKDAKRKLARMQKEELKLTKMYLKLRRRFENYLRKIKCEGEAERLLKVLLSSTPELSKPA